MFKNMKIGLRLGWGFLGLTAMLIIVGLTGSFHFALAYVGAVALIGAASYIFVLGDVKRIEVA